MSEDEWANALLVAYLRHKDVREFWRGMVQAALEHEQLVHHDAAAKRRRQWAMQEARVKSG